ncbi:NAD-dependent epimerase/dehydratase family protein [Halomarina halobia]|uniref:NAD-dependent epimerase/dehydratase family protein n=1 Tax=Halomarina halobia TaxID=3033386 RepID=A0ABD6AG11_9EURY|nr:NAD(P)-dependent oxidoreductase [Halomarina sp. PSR21]
MRLLVTGGHGFIGSHVLRQLVDAGHEVTCFDIAETSPIAASVANETTFVRGDVTDPVAVYDTVAATAPDRIIHLASLLGRPSELSPRRAYDVNVTGTINVLEAAVTFDIERVVAASSVAAYGSVPDSVARLDETVVQQPRNVYGVTKYTVERLGRTYENRHDVPFVAIEPVHGIGPDRVRGNVEDAYLIKAAVDRTPLTVPNVDRPYEPIYVGDEARAFVVAAVADDVDLDHDRYVIGTGELITLADIAEWLRDLIPDAEINIADRRADDEFEGLPPTDTSRIEADLGWEPTLRPGQAVETYVEWLRTTPNAWSIDPEDAPWSFG